MQHKTSWIGYSKSIDTTYIKITLLTICTVNSRWCLSHSIWWTQRKSSSRSQFLVIYKHTMLSKENFSHFEDFWNRVPISLHADTTVWFFLSLSTGVTSLSHNLLNWLNKWVHLLERVLFFKITAYLTRKK